MRRGGIDGSTLRAAWWAQRAARRTRRELRRAPLEDVLRCLPPVPDLPDSAGRGVGAVLRRHGYTCLVRSVVRQAWEGAHGRHRELVIGVTAPGAGFRAHAWLEGDQQPPRASFAEISRRGLS